MRPAERGSSDRQDDQAELEGQGLGQLQEPEYRHAQGHDHGNVGREGQGTIRKPPSAIGLCNSDYPVSFTAKRR